MKRTEVIAPANTYEELIEAVKEFLPGATSSNERKDIAQYIGESLLKMGKLLKYTLPSGAINIYLVLQDDRIIPLHGNADEVSDILFQMGIYKPESIANLVTSDLVRRARVFGQEVMIARYSDWDGQRLYVSAGPKKMIVGQVIDGECKLEEKPNGYNGVLFLSDHVFTHWSITEEKAPAEIPLLNPSLESSLEVSHYSPAIQQTLATAWMTSVLANLRPLPILVSVGQKGCGKSTFAKAVSKLFCGDNADVATAPANDKDFKTNAAASVLYAIDNLDEKPGDWMSDSLAIASTGGTVKERALYTNGTVYEAELVTSILITTRTAEFAGRADVRERCIPLFFTERTEYGDEKALLFEVCAKRSKVLTWLMKNAVMALHEAQGQPGLNRFVSFGHVLRHLNPEQYQKTFELLERAQRLSLSEGDELLNAIIRYNQPLEGSPTQIVKTLETNGYGLKHYGGGKAIARALREIRRDLELAGWKFNASSFGHGTVFRLLPPSRE